jgi:hypothetical protein
LGRGRSSPASPMTVAPIEAWRPTTGLRRRRRLPPADPLPFLLLSFSRVVIDRLSAPSTGGSWGFSCCPCSRITLLSCTLDLVPAQRLMLPPLLTAKRVENCLTACCADESATLQRDEPAPLCRRGRERPNRRRGLGPGRENCGREGGRGRFRLRLEADRRDFESTSGGGRRGQDAKESVVDKELEGVDDGTSCCLIGGRDVGCWGAVLRDAWAYFWNSWYQPGWWHLWQGRRSARSPCTGRRWERSRSAVDSRTLTSVRSDETSCIYSR